MWEITVSDHNNGKNQFYLFFLRSSKTLTVITTLNIIKLNLNRYKKKKNNGLIKK